MRESNAFIKCSRPSHLAFRPARHSTRHAGCLGCLYWRCSYAAGGHAGGRAGQEGLALVEGFVRLIWQC